ncbi:MAG: hypothetical protein NTX04_13335, partial [Verrucomicrobia bacterium]|nr:hypothetical protein [Verrucomicrobiota bacterium]
MPPLQMASICFALLGPILLYLVQRQSPSPRFDQVWSRILATILALSLLSGAASARTVFDDLRNTAPRADGVFG